MDKEIDLRCENIILELQECLKDMLLIQNRIINLEVELEKIQKIKEEI